MKWLIGSNSAGKTVYLQSKLEELSRKECSIVTNLKDTHISGDFDKSRLELILSDEIAVEIFGYEYVKLTDGRLTVRRDNGTLYSDKFINLLNILCGSGDYLILDEPEMSLRESEILILRRLFEYLLPTFIDGYIATHNELFYSLDDDNFYMVENYKLRKIEEDLYDYVGKC